MGQPRWMLWMLCGCLMLAGGAFAQDEPAGRGELDLQRLLASTGRGGGGVNIQDPVWTLQAGPGRQIVMLPMLYTPGDSVASVSRPDVSIRGARFIGFYVPSPQNQANSGHGGGQSTLDLRALSSGDPKQIEKMLLSDPVEEERQRQLELQQRQELQQQRDFDPGLPGGGFIEEEPGTPDFAPRLTRAVQIRPDGTVAWEVDRSINGAEMKQASEQNLYGYKLSPDAMREAEPARPERLERQANEDSRAFSQRRREQEQLYRDELNTFRDLRDRVRDLPDQFNEPMPEVIYAVFDAPSGDNLELQGAKPFPWTLKATDADSLRQLAQNRGGGAGQGPSQETSRAISVLRNFLVDRHPMSFRAVAIAAHEANLPGQVLEGDDGYRLINELLSSDDPLTRQIMLTSVAQTHPPTRASAKLLSDAARTAPPELAETLELASLRAMFAIDAAKSENAGFLVTLVNEAMRDPSGPPAGRVVDELLKALEGSGMLQHGGGGGVGQVDRVDVVLINRVDFTVVPEEQLDEVIASVIRRAPSNTIASGWLDIKLLRSGDDRLVTRTLELLSQADGGSTVIKPMAGDLRAMVFGKPDAEGSSQALDLTLSSVIPLDSANHGIVTAITSSDENRRALAWQVLRHFEIASDPGRGGGGVDNQTATFDLIVDSGLSEAKTPLYLIDFIDNQNGGQLTQRSAERMNEILLRNVGRSAAMRAARKYVASPQRYGTLLPQIQPLERGAIIERLYELLTGSVPGVVGLARDSQSQQARWFVDEMTRTGALPGEKAWAAQQSEDELIRAAASQDSFVNAAAAAALVINAGGTREDQNRLVNALSQLPSRDEDSIVDAWAPIKQQIYTDGLADAAGPHRLVLTLRGNVNPGQGNQLGQPQRGFPPPQREVPGGEGDADTTPAPAGDLSLPVIRQVELGVVELTVNGLQISLSTPAVVVSVPSARLAIRINDVSSLTSFNSPDLGDLPLSQMRHYLDLLPQDDGSWTGAMQLPDGRTMQVSLQPS